MCECEYIAGEKRLTFVTVPGSYDPHEQEELTAKKRGVRLNKTAFLRDSWKGWSHLNRFLTIQRAPYEEDTRG